MSTEQVKGPMIHASDLKAMLKDNREIGKISNGIPQICASVCDEFAKELILASLNEEKQSLDLEKLIEVLKNDKKYDFLESFIPKYEEALENKKSKKKE